MKPGKSGSAALRTAEPFLLLGFWAPESYPAVAAPHQMGEESFEHRCHHNLLIRMLLTKSSSTAEQLNCSL
jgi:hypothetical protein